MKVERNKIIKWGKSYHILSSKEYESMYGTCTTEVYTIRKGRIRRFTLKGHNWPLMKW